MSEAEGVELPDNRRPAGADRRGIVAWCLFDWANSSYPTVIVTFVFAAYFTGVVAENDTIGTALWGNAMSLSALGVAIVAPIFGAIADHGGPRKPWIALFSAVCILVGAGLWTIAPEQDLVWRALILAGLANAGFELAQVFYNAMLPDVAPRGMLGRISGWAWATGYAGGLVCLALCLVLLALPEQPILGLDKESYEHVRATGPFVALWYAVFCLPMFLLAPDQPKAGVAWTQAVRLGLGQLRATLGQLGRYRVILRFLIARMIYIDGLNTLFAFGGIYAAGTFGMGFQEILVFGILLNVTSGLGAAAFAWIDDWIGSKRTIMIAVGGLTVSGAAILLVDGVTWFMILGAVLGIFIGPAQAASRTLMARLAPAELRTEMFGLYALSGKATAFLGPALVGWVTLWADSQRAGMATILLFFLVGMALLAPLKEPRDPA